jgi:hypothetical protein
VGLQFGQCESAVDPLEWMEIKAGVKEQGCGKDNKCARKGCAQQDIERARTLIIDHKDIGPHI